MTRSSGFAPRLLLVGLAVALLVALAPAQAHADAGIELKGQVGMASATHEQTDVYDDPIFNVGGGGQLAAMLGLGGLAVGLNFRYWYESHITTPIINSGDRSTMAFSVPSVGLKVNFDLMQSVYAGIWLNYGFGTACIENNSDTRFPNVSWGLQGLDAGVEAVYAYQMKPYKTFILFGLFAHYQYLVGLSETQGAPDLTTSNIGIGATIGTRFDFSF